MHIYENTFQREVPPCINQSFLLIASNVSVSWIFEVVRSFDVLLIIFKVAFFPERSIHIDFVYDGD